MIIRKLLLYYYFTNKLNCNFKIALLLCGINKNYEDGLIFASLLYYFDIIKLIIIIGSNINLKIVYDIHYKLYNILKLYDIISFTQYIFYINFMKNLLICLV